MEKTYEEQMDAYYDRVANSPELREQLERSFAAKAAKWNAALDRILEEAEGVSTEYDTDLPYGQFEPVVTISELKNILAKERK
jgi:hypothetical protein